MNLQPYRTTLTRLRENQTPISLELFGHETLDNVVIIALVFDAEYPQGDTIVVRDRFTKAKMPVRWADVIRVYELALDNTPVHQETTEQKTERLIATYAAAFSLNVRPLRRNDETEA